MLERLQELDGTIKNVLFCDRIYGAFVATTWNVPWFRMKEPTIVCGRWPSVLDFRRLYN